MSSGNYAEIGAGVDQESQVADSDGDERVVRICGTCVCRQNLSLPFLCCWKEHGGVHLRDVSLIAGGTSSKCKLLRCGTGKDSH